VNDAAKSPRPESAHYKCHGGGDALTSGQSVGEPRESQEDLGILAVISHMRSIAGGVWQVEHSVNFDRCEEGTPLNLLDKRSLGPRGGYLVFPIFLAS